jgi:hypothetical protein
VCQQRPGVSKSRLVYAHGKNPARKRTGRGRGRGKVGSGRWSWEGYLWHCVT